MNRELLEEVLYALEYASDMTKPEGLSGCDCPICTMIPKVKAELAKPKPHTEELIEDSEGPPCKTHPDAPHGYLRNASINAGRLVCECEFWSPGDAS